MLSSLNAVLFALALQGADWPQWRGPKGLGISEEKAIPIEWSESKNIRWKTPIPGRGHSSPIVWGKRIFLTTAIEGPAVPEGFTPIKHRVKGKELQHPDWAGSDHHWTLKLFCLERDSGKIFWERTAYEGMVYDYRHRKNTYASPTAATDGRYVYAYFGSEGLYCYDFDGKLIWQKSLGGLGTIGMGPGTSPVLSEDKVILVCDQEFDGVDSFMVAFNRKTGAEVWRTKRQAQVSWATPLLVRTSRGTEMIVAGAEYIISYMPATGQELWRVKGVEIGSSTPAVPTPVTDGENVYVTAGFLEKRAIAIRLGGSGDLTKSPHVVWTYHKGTGQVPSPLLYQGYVYLMTDAGILTCLEAKTGKVMYEGGRIPVPATFTASPIAYDGKILITSEDGDTFVLKAGPTFEVLRTNSIGEPVFASMAVSDGTIFIRGQHHLYAVRDSSGP